MVLNTILEEPINAAVEYPYSSSDEQGTVYGTYRTPHNLNVRVYKRRFLMMLLYSFCTMLNGFQWIQFNAITSIVSCYYNVSVENINWTSILFMIMFVPFMIPISWMMSVKGLKFTLVIASLGNTLTSCIQCLSMSPDKFYLVIISQTVAAVAQCFSVSMPSYVAALWFPPKEVSLACAVGIYANQIGIAFGFIVPPLLVPSHCHDLYSVKMGLWWLAVGQAVINAVVYVLIVTCFEDKPPIPPSLAEAKKPDTPDATLKSIGGMLRDVNFVLLLLAYGMLLSVYFAITTLLNQMVVKTFPGKEVDAGWMGLETIFAGMFGSLLSGYILDRTHLYRLSSIVVQFLSLGVMIAYTLVSCIKILWMQFMMFGLIGFIMTSYQPIGFEFAAEITYPQPEGTSASLIIAFLSLLGIFVTYFGSWLQQTYGNLQLNLFFCTCIAISCGLSVFIRGKPKRCIQNEVDEPLLLTA